MRKLLKYSFLILLVSLYGCNGGSSSDGSASTSEDYMEPVTEQGSSKIHLTWLAPGERVNGEKLHLYEIGGYELIWRKVGDVSWRSILINDENGSFENEYDLEGLEAGNYELAMATFDIDGNFGHYSKSIFFELK